MADILFVSVEGKIGGAERSLLLLLESLKSVHSLALACPPCSPLADQAAQLDCRCHPLPARQSRSYFSFFGLVYWIKASLKLRQVCRRSSPDIIHANSVYSAVICFLAVWSSKAVFVWHSRDFLSCRFISRFCGKISRYVLAISHAVESHLLLQGVPQAKIRLVYNGISPDSIAPRMAGEHPVKQDFGTDTAQFVFINVGQFVPWKKQILFLDAVRIVAGELGNARFWLVGGDKFASHQQYANEINQYIRENGLEDRVILPGWIDDMSTVWQRADILVHTADREPFGRVVIEAMAARVPVIAVDAAGPREIINNGKTGILVPPNSPAALAEAMLSLVRKPEFAGQLAAAAREDVRNRWTAARTAHLVNQVYNEICGASIVDHNVEATSS